MCGDGAVRLRQAWLGQQAVAPFPVPRRAPSLRPPSDHDLPAGSPGNQLLQARPPRPRGARQIEGHREWQLLPTSQATAALHSRKAARLFHNHRDDQRPAFCAPSWLWRCEDCEDTVNKLGCVHTRIVVECLRGGRAGGFRTSDGQMRSDMKLASSGPSTELLSSDARGADSQLRAARPGISAPPSKSATGSFGPCRARAARVSTFRYANTYRDLPWRHTERVSGLRTEYDPRADRPGRLLGPGRQGAG